MKLFLVGVIFGPLPAKIGGWDELGKTDRCEVGSTEGGGRRALLRGGGDFFSGVLMVSLSPQRLAQMSGQLWSDLHPACCLYPPSVCLSVCVLDYFHPKPHQKYQNIFCLYENAFLSFLCLRLRLWCSLRLLFRADETMKDNINVLKMTKIPA